MKTFPIVSSADPVDVHDALAAAGLDVVTVRGRVGASTEVVLMDEKDQDRALAVIAALAPKTPEKLPVFVDVEGKKWTIPGAVPEK